MQSKKLHEYLDLFETYRSAANRAGVEASIEDMEMMIRKFNNRKLLGQRGSGCTTNYKGYCAIKSPPRSCVAHASGYRSCRRLSPKKKSPKQRKAKKSPKQRRSSSKSPSRRINNPTKYWANANMSFF